MSESSDYLNRIIECAEKEIGVVETSENYSSDIARYKAWAKAPKHTSWCVDFAQHCCRSALLPGKKASIKLTSGSIDLFVHSMKNGLTIPIGTEEGVLPGMLLVACRICQDKKMILNGKTNDNGRWFRGHTMIVSGIDLNKRIVSTIEGNTTIRKGLPDGVYRKSHKLDDPLLLGFVVPVQK